MADKGTSSLVEETCIFSRTLAQTMTTSFSLDYSPEGTILINTTSFNHYFTFNTRDSGQIDKQPMCR